MSFVQRDAAIRVVFNAIEKTTAVQNVIKRRRNKAGLVFIAEAAKGVVLYSDFVVDADIKIVAALAPPGIGKKIVSRDVGIRLWKQRLDFQSHRIKTILENDVARKRIAE